MYFSVANTELKALLRLLEDPDAGVYRSVSNKLVSYGKNVIPHLETEWEMISKDGIQDRIVEIIHQIELDECLLALAKWKENGANDVFEGAIIASMFQYPHQPTEEMLFRLERLRKDVWIELNDNLTSLEKIRVLNHIVYEVHHFSPYLKYRSSDQYWFPVNVMEQLKGSPTALAILYKALADKLELPVVGINLPDHFILAYKDMFNHTSNEVLFYINPFNKGAVFGKSELERYVSKLEIEMNIDDLRPISNVQMIQRLLTDLRSFYRLAGRYQKLEEVEKLLAVL